MGARIFQMILGYPFAALRDGNLQRSGFTNCEAMDRIVAPVA
jgi:hypothetical protein